MVALDVSCYSDYLILILQAPLWDTLAGKEGEKAFYVCLMFQCI